MSKVEKLYQKAVNSPKNFRFNELTSLAESVGLEFKRQKGSHKIYVLPGTREIFNCQPDKNGQAKQYQVTDLLDIIDLHNLLGGD